ncbi:MAG: DUF6671 family protein [Cyanobacteria bacterium P01_D01_bin.1]
MSALSSFFTNRTVIIATMHHKEQVIAPVVESAMGVKTQVPRDFDTDCLGTFTRDVQRPADQLATARLKAEAALELTGESIAIASEGSFGPHPQIPFAACDRELVFLLDTQHQLEIVGEVLSTQTNFQGQTIHSVQAALDFAQTVGFPEHGLVVMGSEMAKARLPKRTPKRMPERTTRRTPDSSAIAKGITTEASLIEAVTSALEQSPNQQAHIETDMRALYNPTRMQIIAEATVDLVQKVSQRCPNCGYPGFTITQRYPGLPCSLCQAATLLTLSVVYECQHCHFRETRQFPEGNQFADPTYCSFCNP